MIYSCFLYAVPSARFNTDIGIIGMVPISRYRRCIKLVIL